MSSLDYLYQQKFVNAASTNIGHELICLQCKTVYNTDILAENGKLSEYRIKAIPKEFLNNITDKVCIVCSNRHPLHERPPHNVTHNYTHTYIDPANVKQLLEPMVKKFLEDARSAIMQDITDFYSARDEELSNTPYIPEGKTLLTNSRKDNGDGIPKPGYTSGTLFH